MINITAARKSRKSLAELNSTPLIDMVCILLIFFLVTTSFVKETGIEIQRPLAATAADRPQATILVGISAENRVFMQQREIDVRAVRANVAQALAENPEGQVVVVADRVSQTGTVIAVVDACRAAGAPDVAVAARAPEH